MNEYLIGLKNGSNTERTTAHVRARDWFEALDKALDTHGWAFTAEVLAQNGEFFDRSGKLHV